MPPRKKAAASVPSTSLKDCNIAFANVRLPPGGVNNKSLADFKEKIAECQGEFTAKVEDCTHLVATQEQYDKNGARIAQGVANDDVHIVSFAWLEAALESKTKVDEATYILHDRKPAAQSQTVATDTTASKGKKRSRAAAAAADADDDGADANGTSSASKKVNSEPEVETSQPTGSKAISIPLDDGVPLSPARVVFQQDDTVYDATLNQTNAGFNNNKFYRLQILHDGKDKYWCWMRWGRVGERGQSKMLGHSAFAAMEREFMKKFREKNGNPWEKRFEPARDGKYSFVERNYEVSDDEDEDTVPKKKRSTGADDDDDEDEQPMDIQSKLAEPVQRLMSLIFNQEYFNNTFASLDYDAHKMPLGKLSKRTLLDGYEILKELAALQGTSRHNDIASRSNRYFSLIPHAFGRNRPPILSQMNLIKKEIELLETLTDMQLASNIMKEAKKDNKKEALNILDRQYQGLGMEEMTPLDPSSVEFHELSEYLNKSSGHTHGIRYKVVDIFRIERHGEQSRFASSPYANIQNTDRRLLWHGSRCTNFGGILSQGLRIAPPEAPVSGYMFGKGVYLADMSTKSANYCNASLSGGVALLLLCEAELGNPPLKLTNSDYNAGEVAKKDGKISTWGVGQTAPPTWKDASILNDDLKGARMPDVKTALPTNTNEDGAWLQYNEYIVYDVAQIRLRYLFRVDVR